MSSLMFSGIIVLEVNCNSCCSDSSYSRIVAMLFCRCLLISSGVSSDHVMKLFCLIACMKVQGVNERHIACRYVASYCLVCLFLIMILSLLYSCRIWLNVLSSIIGFIFCMKVSIFTGIECFVNLVDCLFTSLMCCRNEGILCIAWVVVL